ncbi:DISARM system phospholipase D-like protein DrmC [Candidatus Poriferisodalis sp.]|uniref:DISARM system phospholipase D-like protein DrmC n=1 Tax=Candidatus Poriferisodalis sp. TaxID=3101277 RepID=UPI003B026983
MSARSADPQDGGNAPGSRVASLPAHLRKRLADACDSGTLPDAPSPLALRSVLGMTDGSGNLAADLAELARLGITGRALAVWVRSLDEAGRRSPALDLVWSGPEVPGLHARDTRRVYEELVRTAEQSVWMSTYVYFDGPQAFAELARRMDEVDDLRTVLMLNIQRARGDTTAGDHLVRRFAERFWGTDWPGTSRPAVYFDPRSLDPDGPTGVLHAKAVVVDDEAVFITSANLTAAALDRNIELGLLTRDSALAASVTAHFQGLIDTGLLKPLPSA